MTRQLSGCCSPTLRTHSTASSSPASSLPPGTSSLSTLVCFTNTAHLRRKCIMRVQVVSLLILNGIQGCISTSVALCHIAYITECRKFPGWMQAHMRMGAETGQLAQTCAQSRLVCRMAWAHCRRAITCRWSAKLDLVLQPTIQTRSTSRRRAAAVFEPARPYARKWRTCGKEASQVQTGLSGGASARWSPRPPVDAGWLHHTA